MAIAISNPLNDESLGGLILDWTETEINTDIVVRITLTGSDAAAGNTLLARANAAAALGAYYPMGPAGALTVNPRCQVVRYQVQKIDECDRDVGATGAINYSEFWGRVFYSTNCVYRTKWRWAGGLQAITSPFDYDGNTIAPAGTTVPLPATTLQFQYSRVEASWHWRVEGSGEPSSDPAQPLLRRVGYCMNRVNQVAFLGFSSDVFKMEPIQQDDLPSGEKVTTYLFTYLDYRYGDGKYERPGLYRLSNGTQVAIAGRAAFSSILQLEWPTVDGGGPL